MATDVEGFIILAVRRDLDSVPTFWGKRTLNPDPTKRPGSVTLPKKCLYLVEFATWRTK